MGPVKGKAAEVGRWAHNIVHTYRLSKTIHDTHTHRPTKMLRLRKANRLYRDSPTAQINCSSLPGHRYMFLHPYNISCAISSHFITHFGMMKTCKLNIHAKLYIHGGEVPLGVSGLQARGGQITNNMIFFHCIAMVHTSR